MERSKVMLWGGAGILAVAAVLYAMRQRDTAAALAASTVDPAKTEVATAGATGFNSNIAVNVNADAFNQLSNRFMPMFGMVGVGVVNSQPTIDNVDVTYNVTNLSPPPAPTYLLPGASQQQIARVTIPKFAGGAR